MEKISRISWFPSTTSSNVVLTSNGKSLDKFFTKCVVEESAFNYTLDGTALKDVYEYLNEEDILKVKIDYGFEIFRISKVTTSTRYIDIVARQIALADSLSLYLEDVRPTNVSGQGALSHLMTNASGTKEVMLQSNITSANTAYYQDMSLYKALFDCDNSFIKRWGGEVQFRGYTITINTSIGSSRGVSIREGKQLTGFSGTSNIDNLTTRARGKGYNGLKGNWIDSPLKSNYTNVYSKTIEYQDVKVKGESDADGFETEALAKSELDRRIALEFSNNDIDKLKATYTINFVQLEKTEEYKNYIQAERVYIGDTIRVYVPKLNVDINVRVINRKYDILSTSTKETKLSNVAIEKAISMNSIINDLKSQYANTNNKSIASYIDSIIKAGMKDSYLVVRENELLVMDTKDINTAINVTRFNKNGLGFSHNGYYGHYDYGFTSDGKINASLISTGILSTILIQNADGSFQIDLSKKGGASFFNNGKKAMEMSGNALKLYNWGKEGDYIGSVGSLIQGDNPNQPIISIWNDIDSAVTIGYQSQTNNTIPAYVYFDKYGILTGNTEYPIIVNEAIKFYQKALFDNIYTSTYRGVNKLISFEGDFLGFGVEGGGAGMPFSVDKNGNANFSGEVHCGSLSVSSTNKNRIMDTTQGKVRVNAVESPEYLFTDRGRGCIGQDGACFIKLEKKFTEIIETYDYDLIIQPIGPGQAYYLEEECFENSFIVHGTPYTNFKYFIVANQKNMNGKRLEKFDESKFSDVQNKINEMNLQKEKVGDEVNG